MQTLSQLIKHIRKENQALHNDLASVKQLYTEAQQDNQMLRDSLHQYENRRKESSSDANEKIRLIEQLENAQNKVTFSTVLVKCIVFDLQKLDLIYMIKPVADIWVVEGVRWLPNILEHDSLLF